MPLEASEELYCLINYRSNRLERRTSIGSYTAGDTGTGDTGIDSAATERKRHGGKQIIRV